MSLRPILESAISRRLPVRIWALSGFDELADDPACRHCDVVCVTANANRRRQSLRHVWKAVTGAIRMARLQNLKIFGTESSEMADSLLSYFNWQEVWAKRFSGSQINVAIVTSESSPINKAFVEEAIRSGARVCHFCHGLPFASHAVTQSSDMFAFSRVDANWFRSRVPRSTRIHAIGNPRMSQTRSKVLQIQAEPPESPVRILFLSNGVECPYTFEHEAEDFSILKLPRELGQNTILRVRPHPREQVEVLEQSLRNSGLVFEISRNRSLAEDIAWAHVCATPWSTALLEAISCERACFWTNARNDRMVGTGEYIDAGLGKLVTNSEEWQVIIRSILEDPRQIDMYRLRGPELLDTGLIPVDESADWYERMMNALDQ